MKTEPHYNETTIHEQSHINKNAKHLRNLVARLYDTIDRIKHHTHSLDYYEHPKDSQNINGAITPISTTMAQALDDTERAVDRLVESLHVFD